jgi:hypothetical protein
MAITSIVHIAVEGLSNILDFEFAIRKQKFDFSTSKNMVIYHNEVNLDKFVHNVQNHHIGQSLQHNDLYHHDIYKHTKKIKNIFQMKFT